MTEVWCRVAVQKPRDFVDTTNFGSIGLGLQAAIGACVAAPERTVTLFTGDGGFMMGGLAEFNTAVRLGLDLIVIICNDAPTALNIFSFSTKKWIQRSAHLIGLPFQMLREASARRVSTCGAQKTLHPYWTRSRPARARC